MAVGAMRLVTEGDLAGCLGDAFRRVFRPIPYGNVAENESILIDPFGEPLQAGLDHRLILWEVLSYSLEGEIEALAEAARSVGDKSFYCLVTEGGGFGFDNAELAPGYEVPLDDLASYKETALFYAETAFFSPASTWGWITSHEQHAVVGGSAPFIEALTASLPPSPQGVAAIDQVHDFLDAMKDYEQYVTPERWLPKHLAHVYGETRARQLLAEHGF